MDLDKHKADVLYNDALRSQLRYVVHKADGKSAKLLKGHEDADALQDDEEDFAAKFVSALETIGMSTLYKKTVVKRGIIILHNTLLKVIIIMNKHNHGIFLYKFIQSIFTKKSVPQEQRDNLEVEQFLKKGKSTYSHIKTMVVFTAKNPDSMEIPRNANKKHNKSLLNTIKSGGYHYVPAIGQFYGNPEHPYVVFNMSLKTAKYFCGKYQQTSFVWSELTDNGIYSEYWEKNDDNSPYHPQYNDYVIKETCDTWTDKSYADDGFTIIGKKFKYSIPFSIFENVNQTFGENIKHIIESEQKRSNVLLSEDKIIDFAMNGVGHTPFLYRKVITKRQ